jgi:cytosine deaminase
MRVAVAGGHGKIGRILIRDLAARGDDVLSLDRNPDYADEIRGWGAEPVTCDLESASEDEVAVALGQVDAVVFAAGAGPGSGPDRKWTMDRDGAVKLSAAARANGVRRYVIVSSIGADSQASGEDTFAVYLRAKGEADEAVAASGLDFTIVRPTSLSDDPGAGTVEAAPEVERREVSREDVAAALAAVLVAPNTVGLTFELTSGDTPVDEAIAAL